MTKTSVALLYGGRSVEHGVSINSARNIFEFIDKTRFQPIPIGITREGKWYLTADVNKDIAAGQPLQLNLDPADPSFVTADGKRHAADIVFPVLHGTDGEDGSIQGLLKAMDLPMVGTGVLGSSMAMSKIVTKRLLKEAGLPVTRSLSQTFGSRHFTFDEVKVALGLPFMVKASSLGSSVGVSKVKSEADFAGAVADSLKYDDGLLFEEFIEGREIECAILGNDPPEASLPGEIVVSKKYEFYTFDAKYVDGTAVTIEVPAKLDADAARLVQEVSVRAYVALNCQDFARVDLFLTKDRKVYVNEINTIPGFTNSSMYPMMWKERGISFTELITRLLALAAERFEKGKRIEREFSSSLKF